MQKTPKKKNILEKRQCIKWKINKGRRLESHGYSYVLALCCEITSEIYGSDEIKNGNGRCHLKDQITKLVTHSLKLKLKCDDFLVLKNEWKRWKQDLTMLNLTAVVVTRKNVSNCQFFFTKNHNNYTKISNHRFKFIKIHSKNVLKLVNDINQ